MILHPQGDAGAAPGKEASQEAPHACSGLQVHSEVGAAALCGGLGHGQHSAALGAYADVLAHKHHCSGRPQPLKLCIQQEILSCLPSMPGA